MVTTMRFVLPTGRRANATAKPHGQTMSIAAWASLSNSNPLQSLSHQQRWTRVLPVLIVGLILLVAIGAVFDIAFDTYHEGKQTRYQSEIAQVRLAQSALLDSENGFLSYVTSGRLEALERYLSGTKELASGLSPLLPQLDRHVPDRADVNGTPTLVSQDFEDWLAGSSTVVRRYQRNDAHAETASLQVQAEESFDRLRSNIGSYLDQLTTEATLSDGWGNTAQSLLPVFNLGCALVAAMSIIYAFRSILGALGLGFIARHQVEQLFFMGDMLQSAAGRDDTNEVLRTTSARLLPGFSGALYVFNNSRDRLDLSTSWGDLSKGIADHIGPTSCWALKCGKPHLNHVDEGALRCNHAEPGQTTLEIPMAARGQLYGLLTIASEGVDAVRRLDQIRPIAIALGDAMSLALSSIDLRERLRNLALRDSLTSLYNRRFLEEMLERLCADAERRKAPISAIMMDVDHFKKLNDQHGHAAGDAVLREVAAAILSCLRSVDVVCRYGGEEFAVLLPDCSLAIAAAKAEQIRSRVSERTTAGGAAVTISLGVASIPETCGGLAELLPAADAALYEAKQQGRDRVVSAQLRPSAQKLSLIDAGSTARPSD
jgi:diguanylate cyclase (GGDEF)-like protein